MILLVKFSVNNKSLNTKELSLKTTGENYSEKLVLCQGAVSELWFYAEMLSQSTGCSLLNR